MNAQRRPDRTSLLHRPLFLNRPPGTVTQAFLRHIAETGSPETFESISTTRPPLEGELKVLTRFSAPRTRRPNGDLAPCPICSPQDPQYLTGVLIWCQSEAAIYAIGVDCAIKLWTDGRLDQEIALHDRMTRHLSVENALLDRLPRVPSLRAWVAEHRPLADLVDTLCKSFRRDAPGLRRDLADAARGDALLMETIWSVGSHSEPHEPISEVVLGQMLGGPFVSKPHELVKTLALADLHLGFVDFGATDNGCLEAVCGMTEPEQRKADVWVREGAKSLAKVASRIDAAVDFMSPSNLRLIKQWGSTHVRPLNAIGDGKVVRLDRGAEVWFARLDVLRKCHPIPAI